MEPETNAGWNTNNIFNHLEDVDFEGLLTTGNIKKQSETGSSGLLIIFLNFSF